VGKANRERRKAKQRSRANRARPTGRSAGLFEQPSDRRERPREAADALVAAALNAHLDQNEAALAFCLESLTAPPDGLTSRRAVNLALAEWFDRLVESVWRRGWQPVDVHRIVHRRAGQRQARLVVDAMAGQMRRYAPATVDDRWTAQLGTLGATVWWDRDENWLDAWGGREALDRAATLADAVELLDLLYRLPTIESLCPPPGAARPGGGRSGADRPAGKRGGGGPGGGGPGGGGPGGGGPGGGGPGGGGPGGGGSDPRILDRVRALLAKAESTEFTDEAEALTAKAQQIMARHSIDEALLAAREGSAERPGGRRVGIDNPYEAAKAMLLNVVAAANRCRSVWSKSLGFATVVGFQPDLDAVELLYTSLLVQATTAITQAGSRQDPYGRSRTRSFRQSFLTSFATRIGERLADATDQASKEARADLGENRLLPVLAARNDAVQEATETMFPELVAQTVSANDREGWAAGRAAADLATLNTRDTLRPHAAANPAG